MNIYVGNLSYSAAEEDLRGLFSQFGEVEEVKLISDHATGKSKGFAFVTMTSEEEGDKAIDELDGSEFQGRNIKVNKARPKREGGGGGFGGGGNRRGGGGGNRRGGGGRGGDRGPRY